MRLLGAQLFSKTLTQPILLPLGTTSSILGRTWPRGWGTWERILSEFDWQTFVYGSIFRARRTTGYNEVNLSAAFPGTHRESAQSKWAEAMVCQLGVSRSK